MLEANSRRVFLNELSPPDEYSLDRAIATTFSLDLLSLLMAPLSMVLFECKCQEDALKDPIAILEALRRVSGRFSVFCQQGRISVPQNDTPLFRYLEKAVVEVQPKDNQGVFHAKTFFASPRTSRLTVPGILCLLWRENSRIEALVTAAINR